MTTPVGAFTAPLYIAWEITHRCNARCLHCYSNSSPESKILSELSTEESLSVIDQLADAGLMVLAFSGGEPLLRKDWERLVHFAIVRGMTVNVGTNGSTITADTADALRDTGLRSVTVSIDSHQPAAYNHFRQLDGLHARAVRAVSLLASRGIRVVVGFTPTKLNWKDGPEVIKLARELGAAAVNLSEYVPAGRGGLNLALSPQDLQTVLREWIEMREQYTGEIDIIWHDCRVGLLVSDAERRKYVGCGAGRLVGRILPDGTVTPCVFLSTPIGSFRTSTFKQMWFDSNQLRFFRERQGHISGNCGDCEHLLSCGGCRAVAFAYSGGDALAGDPHCWIKQLDPGLSRLAEGESLPV